MHLSRFSPKRRRVAAFVLLTAGLLAAASTALAGAFHSRAATDHSEAVRAALHALHVDQHAGPEIVFALQAPLPPGTSITRAGPGDPTGGGRASSAPAQPVLRTQHAAWFFYEDLGPFQAYQHPGRVALV